MDVKAQLPAKQFQKESFKSDCIKEESCIKNK